MYQEKYEKKVSTEELLIALVPLVSAVIEIVSKSIKPFKIEGRRRLPHLKPFFAEIMVLNMMHRKKTTIDHYPYRKVFEMGELGVTFANKEQFFNKIKKKGGTNNVCI